MTLRGGRRCALPPAPPTRFFRLAPVRLWTDYVAGVILCFGSFPVTLRGGRSFPVTLRGGRRWTRSLRLGFAGGGAAPSPPAPPTRFYRLAPVRLWTCYLASVILRLGSFPVTLRGGRSFPVTLRGERRCALPPAPPTRFYRLAPVRLWTCYLAGVILVGSG